MRFFDKFLQLLGLNSTKTEEEKTQPVEQAEPVRYSNPDKVVPPSVARQNAATRDEADTGKLAKEVAADLGIVFKNTDNLNTRIVNLAAAELMMISDNKTDTKNRESETRRYSLKEKLKIQEEIETRSILVDGEKGICEYKGVPFRIIKRF